MAYFGENAIQAWVAYNGSTNTIRNSYNCSVVADNGTGDFSMYFGTNIANPCPCVMTITRSNQTVGSTPPGIRSGASHTDPGSGFGSNFVRILHRPTSTAVDANYYGVAIISDT
tara:strand:- start:424 stop:765 length:342 start_codon:yes stop_codon:yes gene_type:complete